MPSTMHRGYGRGLAQVWAHQEASENHDSGHHGVEMSATHRSECKNDQGQYHLQGTQTAAETRPQISPELQSRRGLTWESKCLDAAKAPSKIPDRKQ